MTIDTLRQEGARGAQYFEDKLAFEITPHSLNYEQTSGGKTLNIIDLRTPDAYAKGHVPAAVNLPFEEHSGQMQSVDKLGKDKVHIVYCYSALCSLATKAAFLMARHGLRVKILTGGFEGWRDNKLSIESGEKAGLAK